MQSFAYANPATVQEALALLAPKWGEADVLAGGTDLLSLMKEHLHTPKRVVNIKNIKELEGIQKTADGIRIGALVTMDELAKNADVKAAAKSLSDAAAAIPSPQIRHMGTVGGDLCQRPRCWYYRQGFGLLAMKDGKSLVPDGANQYHAIFGGGPAYFVSPLRSRPGPGRARRAKSSWCPQRALKSRRPVSSSCRKTIPRVRSRSTPTRSSPKS
jgi:xanthine dehydrogenase YagS FAD-binding subunit